MVILYHIHILYSSISLCYISKPELVNDIEAEVPMNRCQDKKWYDTDLMAEYKDAVASVTAVRCLSKTDLFEWAG